MKCKRCGNELTEDKERGCMECLVCYPKNRVVPVQEEEKKTYLDVIPNEVRVAEMIANAGKDGVLNRHELTEIMIESIREIVRDELENWHIQKPPVTRDEIRDTDLTASESTELQAVVAVTNMTWRQEAKALGIRLSQPTGGARKKVDVLAEIKARTPLADVVPAATPAGELDDAISNLATRLS